jgi:hypothetical protein
VRLWSLFFHVLLSRPHLLFPRCCCSRRSSALRLGAIFTRYSTRVGGGISVCPTLQSLWSLAGSATVELPSDYGPCKRLGRSFHARSARFQVCIAAIIMDSHHVVFFREFLVARSCGCTLFLRQMRVKLFVCVRKGRRRASQALLPQSRIAGDYPTSVPIWTVLDSVRNELRSANDWRFRRRSLARLSAIHTTAAPRLGPFTDHQAAQVNVSVPRFGLLFARLPRSVCVREGPRVSRRRRPRPPPPARARPRRLRKASEMRAKTKNELTGAQAPSEFLAAQPISSWFRGKVVTRPE